ncbi:MAG: hypothetical protein ACOYO1_17885 [Bacteroidales bacterium]
MIYKKASYGHTYSRMKEAQQTKDIDILFLGSSHSYRSFDPRIFLKAGFKTFNLGSSAQTPIQTKVILNQYIDNLNPKLIIYSVSPGLFSVDGIESTLDFIANGLIDYESIKMFLQQKDIKVFNSLIFRFYKNIFNKNKNDIEDSIKGKDRYITGGYVEREMAYFQHKTNEPHLINLNLKQIQSFEDIIDIIHKHKIKLILVQVPITNSIYKSIINNDTINKKMSNYAEYYNFNELIKLDDSLHFYDSHHLNQIGVKVFNAKLIEILSNKKI